VVCCAEKYSETASPLQGLGEPSQGHLPPRDRVSLSLATYLPPSLSSPHHDCLQNTRFSCDSMLLAKGRDGPRHGSHRQEGHRRGRAGTRKNHPPAPTRGSRHHHLLLVLIEWRPQGSDPKLYPVHPQLTFPPHLPPPLTGKSRESKPLHVIVFV
jgi:hypothetical protein